MTDRPFLPYARQLVDEDDIAAVVRVLRSDVVAGGPEVEAFEADLARAVAAPHAVAVSSGTAALHAACFAAGVGPGDEVVVPATTFVATANCARYLGAEVVFADVNPDTGLVDPAHVAERVGPRTRAVLPVHLTGATADVAAVAAAARRVGAVVVEDAAHALGATRDGRPVGACDGDADLAIFSFHPVKHVTTGEGGAVTARDPELARRVRLFRRHGVERDPARLRAPSPGPWYYEQQLLGMNLSLTDLQAALGRSQLRRLGAFVARRRALAARYDALLAELPAVAPVTRGAARATSAYHLYSVLIDFDGLGIRRADVMEGLRARGIGTQVHYIPVPMQPYYAARGARAGDFPGAARYYARTLSLPMFPGMDDADPDRVVEALAAVLRERGWMP